MTNFNWPEIGPAAWAAWGVLIVVFLWSIWHDLLKFLGYSPYSIEKVGDPEDIDPAKNGPEFSEKHGALLKLGFQPLGIIQAKLGKAFSVEETIYGNGPAGIMAEIGSATHSVYFVSSTKQGGSMTTADVPLLESMVGPNYQLKYCPELSVDELLALHQSEVPIVLGSTADLLPATTMQEIMVIQRCFDTHRCSQRMTRSVARDSVTSAMLWVGIPTVALALYMGLDSIWPGFVGIVVAVLLGSLMRILSQHTFAEQDMATDADHS